MNIWLIAAGGLIGALFRYLISKLFQKPTDPFPIGTFIVNLFGCLLLGWLVGCHIGNKWMLFFGTGFCGAFTTFSTLQWEILQFHQKKQHHSLLLYSLLTYSLGFLTSMVGYWIGGLW